MDRVLNIIKSVFDVMVGHYRNKPREFAGVIIAVVVLVFVGAIPFWAALLFCVGVAAIFINASSRLDR